MDVAAGMTTVAAGAAVGAAGAGAQPDSRMVRMSSEMDMELRGDFKRAMFSPMDASKGSAFRIPLKRCDDEPARLLSMVAKDPSTEIQGIIRIGWVVFRL
jgi:hypothetical protein